MAICLISLYALETPEEGKKPHSEKEEEGQAERRGWYSQGDIGRPIDMLMAWIGSVRGADVSTD